MCGIVAVADRHGVEPELVEALRDSIVHRGPDEAGLWLSEDRCIGFGHRRLSIIDLASGQQPLTSGSGRMTMIYNGEVYNHQALRRELADEGVRFSTRCDTEVVLEALEHWGPAALSRLDGMFAFIVWDRDTRELLFARDRLGKKPLYYSETPSGIVAASEIKAVVGHPAVARVVDREALSHYLSFLVAPAPSTLFSGISKLPAGHLATWREGKGLDVSRWWVPPIRDRIEISEAEAAATTLELLTAAVQKRLMSDVPFGVYLSGGVDSSANVALMAGMVDEPVKTFSVAFEDEPSLDELGHARHVATLYGTDHHELVIDDRMVIESLPTMIHHQDEPLADPVCVPLLHLAQATKAAGVTVVQIGEGSDEIFRGYSGYSTILARARTLRNTTRFVPRGALAAGLHATGPFISDVAREFASEALAQGVPPAHGISGLSERSKAKLLTDAGAHPTAHAYLRDLVGSGWEDEEILNVTLDHELRLRLPELLLMRVDKMTMAASVEGRAPFLDRDLVEFAIQLPTRYHWNEGGQKLLLRRALNGVLPSTILDRKKQGFGAPVWRWLRSLETLARQELLRPAMAEYFEREALVAILNAKPTTRSGFELWTVLNFALWHRHFIEGEDLRELNWAGARAAAA